jgi:hypothetical protein
MYASLLISYPLHVSTPRPLPQASMQQLPAEQYGARAKAASGILTRIRLRYSQVLNPKP